MPLSLIANTTRRHLRQEMLADGEIRLERAQVSIVDADEACAGRNRAAQLDLVVHLGEHVDAIQARLVHALAQHGVIHPAHDQQHAVRTVGGRLRDLITRPHEVLAQQRAGADAADLIQIRKLSEEMVALGQHADRVAAGGIIGSRNGDHVKAARDQTGRRRGAFDFRDDRVARRTLQRRQKAAALAHPCERARAQRVVRLPLLLLLERRGPRGVDLL